MSTLAEILLAPARRPQVLRDCVSLLEDEVARKSGLTGIAIKGGYSVLKRVKPSMVEDTLDSLLDEFVEKLSPIHQEWELAGRIPSLESFLSTHRLRIANTLLGITDERARRSHHGTIRATYEKLRPMAVKQIEEAMPAVARMLMKYA